MLLCVEERPIYNSLGFITQSGVFGESGRRNKKKLGETPVPFWGQTSQIPSELFPIVPKTRLTAGLKGLRISDFVFCFCFT